MPQILASVKTKPSRRPSTATPVCWSDFERGEGEIQGPAWAS